MKSKFEPIIKEAIQFYMDEIATQDWETPKFEVVREAKWNGRYDLDTNTVYIKSKENATEFEIAETVLHEMVHWQQFQEGRMSFDESRGLKLRFDNVLYDINEDNREALWEVEAHNLESKLLYSFIQYRA